MNKRKIVEVTVTVLLIIGLGGAAVYGFSKAERYKRDMQYGYTRSLSDLRESVTNIRTTLNKAVYANTATEQNGLTEKLMQECAVAKTSLSTLPLTDNSISNVSKFISQVGDFSMALSRKISEGSSISDSEYKTMQSLESYAKKLGTDLESTSPDFSGSYLSDSFDETSKDFSNFPSLIYDGPFSDSVGHKNPKLTSGKKNLSQAEAQKTAAAFLNTDYEKLVHIQDTAGTMPTYNFTSADKNLRICITKAGGFVSEMSSSRTIGKEKLDYSSASKTAEAFLLKRGISGMKESYYVINNGICLINYAFVQDGAVCYPDLIKVGIALDTGEVVRFQATGYIMNHASRSISTKISLQDAQKKLSKYLTVNKSGIAVIPTPGLSEVLCYEFLCTGNDGDKVLVYINAANGYEEDILILQFSDNGVLVR
jgi:germination protein YpeB